MPSSEKADKSILKPNMSQTIKLKKGFDINLAGKPQKKLGEAQQPETFALKPTDFVGMLRPKLKVKPGDNVKAGSPLLFDKKLDQILYTSPVSGEVADIVRGRKRKLLEIKILADKEIEYEEFKKCSVSDINNLNKEEALDQLLKSGVWPQILQRPYGIVANPEDEPRSIFISGFDTHPLAPDYGFIFKDQDQYFQAGINILAKFTTGTIHLNIDGNGELPHIFSVAEGVQLNKISGPHPAGNVGVQIHHIDPINKGDLVWTINPYGVIQIGKLFLEGKYDASKIVALAGSEVKEPQYYKTLSGASIKNMVEGNLKNDHVRFISGNVLTGNKIEKEGYLGYYDHMISVIPEGDYYEMLGWLKPTFDRLSYHRAFGLLSFLNSNKEYVLDTNLRGEKRAFVQTGVFEKVTPMDIYPTYLIKAIMAEDYDDIEALGIFEVVEEDMALCEFVDVSKHNIQQIIREGINLIRFS